MWRAKGCSRYLRRAVLFCRALRDTSAGPSAANAVAQLASGKQAYRAAATRRGSRRLTDGGAAGRGRAGEGGWRYSCITCDRRYLSSLLAVSPL